MSKYYKSSHIIIIYKKKFLLQKRDKYKKIHFPGFWGLFGGKNLKSESSIQGIEREIQEEINIKIKKPRYLFKLNILGKDLIVPREIQYFIKNVKKLPKSFNLIEGEDYSFFSFKEILKLKINSFDLSAISFYHYNNIKKEKLIPKK